MFNRGRMAARTLNCNFASDNVSVSFLPSISSASSPLAGIDCFFNFYATLYDPSELPAPLATVTTGDKENRLVDDGQTANLGQ